MARKIENKLSKEEALYQLSVINGNVRDLTQQVTLNWGKDPVIWRRLRTLEQKLDELNSLVNQR